VNAGVMADEQARANDRMWSRSELVVEYTRRDLRPVEVVLLVRYRDGLSGRVLELGCGAGRVTGYLAEVATELHALDFSPAMVAATARAYPDVAVAQGDIRDLSRFGDGSFDAVVAPYAVADVLGDDARSRLLDEVRRIVRPGGLFVLSSHNLGAPPGGITLRGAGLLRGIARARHLPTWVRNRRRVLPAERREPGYAILNDIAHDYAALHYYVTRDQQERQLAAHGLALVECLDLDGRTVPPGETAPWSPELHYVARRTDRAR
jgi:SAM-dependent methyltransferase